jgi:hypothetical protein
MYVTNHSIYPKKNSPIVISKIGDSSSVVGRYCMK